MASTSEIVASWRLTWSVIFVANLIVPLWLGWLFCSPAGRIPMMIAAFVLWWLGLFAKRLPQAPRTWLVVGAVALAVSQVCPMIHIVVGAAAITIASADPVDPEFSGLGAAGGLLATVLTGGALILVAFVGGGVLVSIHYALHGIAPVRSDSDDAAAADKGQLPR